MSISWKNSKNVSLEGSYSVSTGIILKVKGLEILTEKKSYQAEGQRKRQLKIFVFQEDSKT